MNAAPRTLRLGFAGTPDFALPALDALARSRHCVLAVFTQPDRPAGRGRTLHASPIKQRAAQLGFQVHQPASFKTPEAMATVRALNLDALVVVAYGLILPMAVLELPAVGCFNVHASILPRWRGAAPIQRALLAGDAMTGISIMRMEAGLDTGPLLAARSVVIEDKDTSGTLHDRLAQIGAELMVDCLDRIADGSEMQLQPQASYGVTHAAKIEKWEATIDWRADADRIVRQVRAFNPRPVASAVYKGQALRIWEAEPVPAPPQGPASAQGPVPPEESLPGTILSASSAGIEVACGRGALRILRLQLPGRKTLTALEFLKAQPLDGVRFAAA